MSSSRKGKKTRTRRPSQSQKTPSSIETEPTSTEETINPTPTTSSEGRGPGGGRVRRRRSRRSNEPETRSTFRVPSLIWWGLGGGGIIAVIVLVALLQGTSGGATTNDHWHANLGFDICGERTYSLPVFPGDLHSHGDSQIHIHPQTASQSGDNASLGTFFENARSEVAGFDISKDRIQVDGEEFRNGDPCADGTRGQLTVTINGEVKEDFLDYLPQDGDVVAVAFR